ncbi:unnamed protein product [Microthlaspi erraticum]|uniref:Uncharacterized protein n=1 Tax=Microthlaspi erraticum TaxID=1685480 RepID=A0A6D2K8K8_9BRAS|nr:unnamed protein product [Microthlaspi erraticum]
MLSKAKKGSHIRTRDKMGFEMKRLRVGVWIPQCPPKNWELGRGLEMGDGHQERSTQLGSAHSIELALDSIELCLELATRLPKTCSCETSQEKS